MVGCRVRALLYAVSCRLIGSYKSQPCCLDRTNYSGNCNVWNSRSNSEGDKTVYKYNK